MWWKMAPGTQATLQTGWRGARTRVTFIAPISEGQEAFKISL